MIIELAQGKDKQKGLVLQLICRFDGIYNIVKIVRFED